MVWVVWSTFMCTPVCPVYYPYLSYWLHCSLHSYMTYMTWHVNLHHRVPAVVQSTAILTAANWGDCCRLRFHPLSLILPLDWVCLPVVLPSMDNLHPRRRVYRWESFAQCPRQKFPKLRLRGSFVKRVQGVARMVDRFQDPMWLKNVWEIVGCHGTDWILRLVVWKPTCLNLMDSLVGSVLFVNVWNAPTSREV